MEEQQGLDWVLKWDCAAEVIWKQAKALVFQLFLSFYLCSHTPRQQKRRLWTLNINQLEHFPKITCIAEKEAEMYNSLGLDLLEHGRLVFQNLIKCLADIPLGGCSSYIGLQMSFGSFHAPDKGYAQNGCSK